MHAFCYTSGLPQPGVDIYINKSKAREFIPLAFSIIQANIIKDAPPLAMQVYIPKLLGTEIFKSRQGKRPRNL
jgi:hypothetical protein